MARRRPITAKLSKKLSKPARNQSVSRYHAEALEERRLFVVLHLDLHRVPPSPLFVFNGCARLPARFPLHDRYLTPSGLY